MLIPHLLSAGSAFLLFLLEPMIAKRILPWFGGGAGIWTTCMLFFQATLFAGYSYAHATSTWLSPRVQRGLHAALLAGSLALLPVDPDAAWKPLAGEDPEPRILGLLGATIGLPFLLLSATSPLLQAWSVRARASVSPFPLYASSNAGSFLALAAYPLLVEPLVGLAVQARGWSYAYALFACALGFVALRSPRGLAPNTSTQESGRSIAGAAALWIALPCCSSMLLLAFTNQLCQEISSAPFLWIVPLAIYLASFVLCFAGDRFYPRRWFVRAVVLAFAAVAYAVVDPRLPIGIALALYTASLFVACMVCHGELARLRPRPERLTAFYLAISFGGAVGAVLVGIVAPRAFASYWELPIAAGATIPLALAAAALDPRSGIGRFAGWTLAAGLAAALALLIVVAGRQHDPDVRIAMRNFYGVLRVIDDVSDGRRLRTLVHGVTYHGSQFLDREGRLEPLTYYRRGTGIALALARHRPLEARRVGVIGLGAGNLAAFGKPGDRFRFYELNPLVLRIARSEFTFLADGPEATDVVLGDARVTLEREPPQGFDLLVVDAFSSGSIPAHLLTEEAFALYRRHLAPRGLLALHVSNNHLDLRPVVETAARRMGYESMRIDTTASAGRTAPPVAWVLVGDDPELFEDSEMRAASTPAGNREVRWTDDFSSLLSILR